MVQRVAYQNARRFCATQALLASVELQVLTLADWTVTGCTSYDFVVQLCAVVTSATRDGGHVAWPSEAVGNLVMDGAVDVAKQAMRGMAFFLAV